MSRSAGITGAGLIACSVILAGCAPTTGTEILSKKSAVELRAIQERTYDTSDKNKVMRAAISTLQDLGYSIDKIEPPAGTISASKSGILEMSASVFVHNTTQMSVRANAMLMMPGLQNTQIDDPSFYQQRFFEPLSKTMFLNALPAADQTATSTPVPAAKSGS